jgi:hypothetical protein
MITMGPSRVLGPFLLGRAGTLAEGTAKISILLFEFQNRCNFAGL